MTRFLSSVFAVLLLAGFSVAQSDRVELFAGFAYVHPDFSLTSPNGLTGWNASANFRVRGHVGLVADFSGFYPGYNPGCSGCGQHAKVHTFLAGPQFSFTRNKVTPFARFLIGDSNVRFTLDGLPAYGIFTSQNSFTFGAGGGVDFRLTRRIALRGQADWLHTRYQTVDNQLSYRLAPNAVRVSTGIVLRF